MSDLIIKNMTFISNVETSLDCIELKYQEITCSRHNLSWFLLYSTLSSKLYLYRGKSACGQWKSGTSILCRALDRVKLKAPKQYNNL